MPHPRHPEPHQQQVEYAGAGYAVRQRHAPVQQHTEKHRRHFAADVGRYAQIVGGRRTGEPPGLPRSAPARGIQAHRTGTQPDSATERPGGLGAGERQRDYGTLGTQPVKAGLPAGNEPFF